MLQTIERQESIFEEKKPKRFKIRAQKTFPAAFQAIHEVRKFVEEHLDHTQADSQEIKDNAVLFVSEAATNALRHATPRDTPQEFVVGIGRERRSIRNGFKKGGDIIFIGDNVPTIGKPPENEENGNGSFLMRQFTKDMGYTTHVPPRVRRHAPAVQKIVWGMWR